MPYTEGTELLDILIKRLSEHSKYFGSLEEEVWHWFVRGKFTREKLTHSVIREEIDKVFYPGFMNGLEMISDPGGMEMILSVLEQKGMLTSNNETQCLVLAVRCGEGGNAHCSASPAL